MKTEYKENNIVKALLASGFQDSEVEKMIENGDINITKSMDNEEKKDPEEKDEISKEKKDPEKDPEEKKNEKEGEMMSKSEMNSLMKSMGDNLAGEIVKSIEASIEKSLNERLARIEDSIKEFGKQAPSFKGANLNQAVIEKSLDAFKDEDNKLEVNIITQRSVAKTLIEKAITNADDDLMKSIGADAKAYLMYPEATTVGESLARYMYNKEGVKFVK